MSTMADRCARFFLFSSESERGLVLDKVADVSSSGAGFFADHADSFWDVRS